MSIFKSILFASIRIALLGVLKAALMIYILFLPNSPSPADARDGRG